MIFFKDDVYTSDEQVDKFSREFKINYSACIGSLIHIFSTLVDLSFAVHKLEKFSSNSRKLYLECLVHLLRYIRDNKNLGLKYYDDMNDSNLSYLLIQASINTENKLMVYLIIAGKIF